MSEAEFVDVKILKQYYDVVEKIVAASSQYQSVSDYINFVLKEMLSHESRNGYSKEDEEVIRKRLEDLGYM
ncbi:MAG: CopG family transcriptional regulator [bacterium]